MASHEAQESNMNSQECTMDGSVDLKGRRVLRSTTGRWKACSFFVGYEVFERMAFYGIAANLVNYLTTRLHEDTVTSARNINNWSGAIWITPMLGAYIADTHWGRYWTFVIFSFIYILGMILLTLAVSLPSLRPPECPQKATDCDIKASTFQIGMFYLALYVLALGNGGTKPNISTIGADQFDEFDPKERIQKVSFFNWWVFSIFFGSLFAQTFLVYIQDHVGFAVGYAVPTLGLIISVAIFLAGTPFYRHKVQKGNPFARMAQVIVAAICKWKVEVAADLKELHELEPKLYVAKGRFPISHTPFLRFLDKAATKDGSTTGAWRLCPLTQVEETKLMIKLLPVWVVLLIPCAIQAQVNTLFIKQGNRLNRHMGSHFQIPSGCLTAFVTLSMLISIVIYDRVLVKLFSKVTGITRGITILQRIGTGILIQVILMVIASITEFQRIKVVKAHGLEGDKEAVTPLTVFILLPQFILMGIADAFLTGILEFFYDQAPESMQSIGTALFASTFGFGSFISSFLLTTVTKVTGKEGHTSWIVDNLNASRLYYYYALLAVLSFVNFIFFLVISGFYVYKRETNEAFGRSQNPSTGEGPTLHSKASDEKSEIYLSKEVGKVDSIQAMDVNSLAI